MAEQPPDRSWWSSARVLLIGLIGVIVVLGLILVIQAVGDNEGTKEEKQVDALAESKDECVVCHRRTTPGIVAAVRPQHDGRRRSQMRRLPRSRCRLSRRGRARGHLCPQLAHSGHVRNLPPGGSPPVQPEPPLDPGLCGDGRPGRADRRPAYCLRRHPRRRGQTERDAQRPVCHRRARRDPFRLRNLPQHRPARAKMARSASARSATCATSSAWNRPASPKPATPATSARTIRSGKSTRNRRTASPT